MPRALILYHFFHPDDVVSSRHFSDLAEGFAERGWEVVAKPCNRGCRHERRKYSRVEQARKVNIERIWRPRFPQARAVGRLLNAIWMLIAWSFCALRFKAPDVVIIGTDPILSILVAIPWKLIRPKSKIVHWCFDLYPEAAIADGTLPDNSALAAALRNVLKLAYQCCDVLIDIGPCMRKRFADYKSAARHLTVTPWALAEPASEMGVDAQERRASFGQASLGLMYSGNFGRAHSYEEILRLARDLRGKSIRFAFSIRGNRAGELRRAVSEQDSNIDFVPFAEESRLEARLSAADIHIVTLREEWTGTVVPSKFFGALAVGRPVLFVGSPHSSVAQWIRNYGVGWAFDGNNHSEIARELCGLAECPEKLSALFGRCHRVYQNHFSRNRVIERIENELRTLLIEDAVFGHADTEGAA